MCELTDKLRNYHPTSGYSTTMRKAADEIDRLRSALGKIHAMRDNVNYSQSDDQHDLYECLAIAEKALST